MISIGLDGWWKGGRVPGQRGMLVTLRHVAWLDEVDDSEEIPDYRREQGKLGKTRSSILFPWEFVWPKCNRQLEMQSGVQNGEGIICQWISSLRAWTWMNLVKAVFWNPCCLPGLLTLGSRIFNCSYQEGSTLSDVFTYNNTYGGKGVFLQNFRKIIEEWVENKGIYTKKLEVNTVKFNRVVGNL